MIIGSDSKQKLIFKSYHGFVCLNQTMICYIELDILIVIEFNIKGKTNRKMEGEEILCRASQ